MTIPFIIADLGPSANQSAKPLAAFFPGYVTTQIPEGMLAQIVGPSALAAYLLLQSGRRTSCRLPFVPRHPSNANRSYVK